MPVRINHHIADRYLELTISGKLVKEDYEQFRPVVEQLIEQHGKLRLLLILDDFHGWNVSALWEDIKFDASHFSDFERIAMVGEKKWHSGMATFCKPFTAASVKYFEKFELDDAREWLTTEATPSPTSAIH